jgi:16S rRNA (adenine1518-N6/adenine1519-N6)-dimethyltransferase
LPSSSHRPLPPRRGHAPRKRFGQHFLHDPRVLAHLVESLSLSKDDVVVEIGPGEGALTYRLRDQVARLEVIEIAGGREGS